MSITADFQYEQPTTSREIEMARLLDLIDAEMMDQRALLLDLADDAFLVLNWARREGMKRDQQLREVAAAFEARLNEKKVKFLETK